MILKCSVLGEAEDVLDQLGAFSGDKGVDQTTGNVI